MNSAKRISNQTINNDEKKKAKQPLHNRTKVMVISAICAVIVLATVIGVCWENLHPRLIFKINNNKIYLNDMMVDIYMNESTGNYMNTLYKQNYGSDYWSLENDDGQTNAELLKDNTLESTIQKYIMFYEADANGYTLSDDDISSAEQKASDAYDQMTAAVRNKSGISKNDLIDYYKKQTLADKYKQAWIDTFDIDDAAITANVSREDYREYDIQYYYIPYTKTDENGTSVDMTDDEKKAALNELTASYTDIASLADFTTYIDDSSSTQAATDDAEATDAAATQAPTEAPGPKAPEGTNIKYTTKSFIETDTADTLGFDSTLLEQIKAMDNDTISDQVLSDSNGCYIIKMVDNNSSSRYDSECQSLITQEENKVFEDEIDKLEVDKYTVDVNDSEWDKVEFGRTTIN